ncbi:MAG: transcriptional regulator, TraR/DksA family [Paenibacillus sp.]|nr:transcriptional regulator, TraR/DksA family [Paenibacillus sp.]
MKHLSQNQLDELRHLLWEEEADLKLHMELNQAYGLEDSSNMSTGELSAYDNHPADLGSELFERSKDIALNQDAERQMNANIEAQKKIDSGSYGLCTQCGEPITFERLQAYPAASTCIAHASSHSPYNEYRPVEEQMLEPAFGRSSVDGRDDETEFDGEDAWQIVESWGTSNTPAMAEDNEIHDYKDMYIEADENDGFVESLESFLATDIYGQHVTVIRNKRYKEYMDSQEGDPLLEPDGYKDI